MSPIGPCHAATVYSFQAALQEALADRALIRVQPIYFDDFNEPEPDIAAVRTRADMYASAHPSPVDVRLLVEVSNSTLKLDRTVKARPCATARIHECWIADLDRNRVVVCRDPEGEVYRMVTEFGSDDTLGPAAYPDVEVAVSRFLP